MPKMGRPLYRLLESNRSPAGAQRIPGQHSLDYTSFHQCYKIYNCPNTYSAVLTSNCPGFSR